MPVGDFFKRISGQVVWETPSFRLKLSEQQERALIAQDVELPNGEGDSVAVGVKAVAGRKGVAVGTGARADDSAVAIGKGAYAGPGSVSIGAGAGGRPPL
jgi:hypothetical protein